MDFFSSRSQNGDYERKFKMASEPNDLDHNGKQDVEFKKQDGLP